MRAAFASTRQAAAFALLLLVLLLLPVLLTKSFLPPREEIYGWMGWDTTGPHPYHHQLIFEEKGDIDIAFIGSSRMTHGIDTPHVQDKLSEMLGRPATVRTLGWGGAGYDALYFTAKDLLENRKVKMIVFDDETQPDDVPNSLAPDFFRFADDGAILTALPLRLKLVYYNAAILGMPKNLLCLLRSNLPADMSPAKMDSVDKFYGADNIVQQLGSIASRRGFNPSLLFDDYGPFIPYFPANLVAPSDVVVYSPETKDRFQFPAPSVPTWQLQFGQRFVALAHQYGVKLVFLHFPTLTEMRSPVLHEREFWPDALQGDILMVGVPSASFLEGISDEDARKLYKDVVHLNKNGQAYFTSIVTPTLLELYAAQNHN